MGLLKSLFGTSERLVPASVTAAATEPVPDTVIAARQIGPINAYATLTQPPAPDFPHVLLGARDRSDPELLPHLNGFAGYIFNPAERQPTHLHWALLEHALRTRHHFSFEADSTALPALTDWASRANAVLFLPDGTVRDPQMHILFDPADATAAEQARIPFPADAEARKVRSRALAEQLHGLRSPDGLPPVMGTGEVSLRSPAEIAARAAALMAVAVRGESLNGGDPIGPSTIFERVPLARTALSPAEQAFLFDQEPTSQAVVNAVWRYEALAVLLWALGRLDDDLPPPTDICDVPRIAQLMVNEADVSQGGRPRDASAILDALDLTYRLHWAVVDARQKGEAAGNLVPGVVAERHYALNWLITYRDADWDEVQTPT